MRRSGELGSVVAMTYEKPEPQPERLGKAIPFVVLEKAMFGDSVRHHATPQMPWRNELRNNLNNGILWEVRYIQIHANG